MSLQFDHLWSEVFWLWGVDEQDVPSQFYKLFGLFIASEQQDLEAWKWLYKNSSKNVRNKLLIGLQNQCKGL